MNKKNLPQENEETKQKVETKSNENKNVKANIYENLDTSKSPFKKGYYDYEGTINKNIKIQMSLYQIDKDIVGTYFYESVKKELKLKGKSGEILRHTSPRVIYMKVVKN